jgi:hypothetical protein
LFEDASLQVNRGDQIGSGGAEWRWSDTSLLAACLICEHREELVFIEDRDAERASIVEL